MLVVLSPDQSRDNSAKLKDRFAKIYRSCSDPENSAAYCLSGAPKKIIVESAIAVEAVLNKNAKSMVEQSNSRLGVHVGSTQRSMTVDELRKVL